MHYYKRNLGDYAKKAGRLSILQHGVYNLLLDACYDREQFPTLAEAVDWTWASSAAEVEAVEFVLRKFFVLEDDGRYVQKRVQEELAAYREMAEKNARIAQKRELGRMGGATKRERSVHGALDKEDEPPPNHKPITNNQEPINQGASVADQQSGPVGPARAGFEKPDARCGLGADAAAAMLAAGLADTSATHPKLLALLAAGVTVAELEAAARYSVERGKGFVYALSRAEGQRRDAAAMAVLPCAPAAGGADPDSRGAIEADAVRLGIPPWQQVDAQGRTVSWQQWADKVRKARAEGVAA